MAAILGLLKLVPAKAYFILAGFIAIVVLHFYLQGKAVHEALEVERSRIANLPVHRDTTQGPPMTVPLIPSPERTGGSIPAPLSEIDEERYDRWTALFIQEAIDGEEEANAGLKSVVLDLSRPRRGFVTYLDSALSGMKATLLVEYEPWGKAFHPVKGWITDLRPTVITNTRFLLEGLPRKKPPFWQEVIGFAGGCALVYGLIDNRPGYAAIGGGLIGARLAVAF